MISDMAKEDIAYLQSLGGRPLTASEIVTIHELAQDALDGAHAADCASAPRVAWCCGVAIFEPSCAAMSWLRTVAHEWWHGVSLELATCWACANGSKGGDFFAKYTDEAYTRSIIECWQKSLSCTYSQLLVATSYALNGPLSLVDDADEKTTAYDIETEFSTRCPFAESIHAAIAAAVGTSIEELSKHPRRIIQSMMLRKMQYDVALRGGKPSSVSGPNRHALTRYNDYVAKLEKELNVEG